jgi:hypothetical protein
MFNQGVKSKAIIAPPTIKSAQKLTLASFLLSLFAFLKLCWKPLLVTGVNSGIISTIFLTRNEVI